MLLVHTERIIAQLRHSTELFSLFRFLFYYIVESELLLSTPDNIYVYIYKYVYDLLTPNGKDKLATCW